MEPLGGLSIPKDELRRVRDEVLKDLFERKRIKNPRDLSKVAGPVAHASEVGCPVI